MENGAFAPKEQMLLFHNIFKYMIQRRQKMLLWSKGLSIHIQISSEARGLMFGFKLHLHPYFMCASSEVSDETAHLCRLS